MGLVLPARAKSAALQIKFRRSRDHDGLAWSRRAVFRRTQTDQEEVRYLPGPSVRLIGLGTAGLA
jgi:hypothetical protein